MDAEWILCPLCGGKTRDKERTQFWLIILSTARNANMNF